MNDPSHCIIVKIIIIIFNVSEQNDFLIRDRHISCGAQKNLVVVDFSEEKMSCFVVGITIQRLDAMTYPMFVISIHLSALT